MRKPLLYLVFSILTGFGLLTLFLSTSVILDLFGVREKEGNYVLFVVWANFISSLLYLISAYGLLISKEWTAKTLGVSAMILAVAFVGLQFYIQSGGIHEDKTIGALIFRISLTLGFTLFAYFTINRKTVR
ncbi:MAG: hypothetical protein K9J06_11590 [Flavobacteriales bacterium]|nr:hypothetical protein [Flavobacteriales bacterium]